MAVAADLSLEANVVEKDYFLGWLLAGIYSNQLLAEKWVFKGGTCLRKCFFETYRFSEDLDFTLTDPTQLDATFHSGCFAFIACTRRYDTAQWQKDFELVLRYAKATE